MASLSSGDLRAVVICPSNPFLSIEPILAIPAIRAALCGCRAPVVAVSPVIGGQAVKGPTAKIMRELGLESGSADVARRYADLLDVFVVDEVDAATAVPAGIEVVSAPTLMTSLEDRERLARVGARRRRSGCRAPDRSFRTPLEYPDNYEHANC